MTPKQVLEAILLALENSRWLAESLAEEEDDPICERYHYGEHCGLQLAIELVRSGGAQILHASDLTQQDEKTPA